MSKSFAERLTTHRIGATGMLAEKRLAKKLKGKLRPSSGAMAGAKGDIDFTECLMEVKSTTSESLSIKHAWLCKISDEALAISKWPALTITFTTGNGKPVMDGEWVLVPLRQWKEIQP